MTTLTLAMSGDVPLDQFSLTLERFHRLVQLLTQEVSRDVSIDWIIDDLFADNAVITIRGESEQPEAVERVGRAYTVIGQALEQHRPIPYSPQIAKAAQNLTDILNGKITSIQFEAGNVVATITSSIPVEQAAGLLGAYGAVEGRVETLTSRRGLGFTLYDLMHDRAIRCHLEPDQAEAVRDAWDRRVIVRGWVWRNPTSGRPVAINPVQSIDLVPEIAKGAYRRARAIVPAHPNAPPAHETIRRLRDAWTETPQYSDTVGVSS